MISSIFLGTPDSSVPALEVMSNISHVRLVITRPDRPRGRSKAPQPSPIKAAARALGLPLAQPESRRRLLEVLAGLAPVDIGVVVAFGMILRPEVLILPRRGFVNVHFSLLPRWRGAAPVERAVLAGDSTSGVTLMSMDRGLDTGPIVSHRTVEIAAGETSGQLQARLAVEGAALLRDDLLRYADGVLVSVPQPVEGVTHAGKIETAEARLTLSDPAETLLRHIQAFNPRPGAYAFVADHRFKIWSAAPLGLAGLEPGELRVLDEALCVGVGDGSITLIEVQPEGSRRMRGVDWARGRRGRLGQLT